MIKDLKKAKARDPNGCLKELFMKEVAGENLKQSMLKMFNNNVVASRPCSSLVVNNIAKIFRYLFF